MTNANNSAAAELSNEFGRPALLVSFKTLTPISSRPKATEQFPIDQVTDSIATAIRAVSVIADCHINTAAWAVFGSASAAAQTIALVETPAGHIVPASTFTYLIAPSGCRKSTVFSAAWQGIFDADTQLQKAHRKRKAALAAQSKGKGTRPVTTDQELCRSAGTIKQIITEPSMEALMRDADTGHPYPAIANPEGQSFLLGFSAGTDPKRAAQTASLLSAGYSSENTNVPRIGADGKAPNRSLDAGQYALGMHLAVQDHSMGYNLILGPAAEFGMSSRVLLAETPQPPVKLPTKYQPETLAEARQTLLDWRNHLLAIREQSDWRILESESGPAHRAIITLNDDAKDALERYQAAFITLEQVTEDHNRIVFDRLPEQICRIAATLYIAEHTPLTPGQTWGMDARFIEAASIIAKYHWDSRQRIVRYAHANDVDESAASIIKTALKWMSNSGAPPSLGKRAYNPEDLTFGWGHLCNSATHIRTGSRHAGDSKYKLEVKELLLECGIFGIAPNGRLALNPAYLDEVGHEEI